MRLFEKAKSKDLLAFVQASGFEIKRETQGFSAKHCPHCSEGSSPMPTSFFEQNGIWRWNCFKCQRGGTIVDFASAIWGTTEMEAAMRLANDDKEFVPVARPAAIKPVSSAAQQASQEAIKEALYELLKGGYTKVTEAFDYLKGRGISEGTIEQACRRGILRFLPASPHEANKLLLDRVGVNKMVAAGLIKPEKRWPAIAFRSLIFFFPGTNAAEFRLARAPKEGESKAIRYGKVTWPWFWKHGKSVKTVYIVEGAIDMLSLVEIGLKEGDAILAMPGTSSWSPHWFEALYERHPDASFILGLDSDKSGKEAAKGISEVLKGLKAPIMQMEPQGGKDWNEHLLAMKALESV